MADLFFALIFLVPIYGLLIWTYFYPEESMLFGKRWTYREEPEFSEAAIGYTKFASVVAIFIITIILVSVVFNNHLFTFIIVLGLFSYVIYAILKLRKKLIK